MEKEKYIYALEEIVEISNQKGKLTLNTNLIDSITTPFKDKSKHLIKFSNKESLIFHNLLETIEHVNAKYKLNLFNERYNLEEKLCFIVH